MKKWILLILVMSCFKAMKNIELKSKNLNEDLLLAIKNNNTDEAIKLIKMVDFKSFDEVFLKLALDNKNLDIIGEILKKEIEVNQENIVKIYELALEDFNCDIIDLIKDKYKLEEGLIDNNKYFLFLCYTSNAEELKKFIEKNSISPKNVKDKTNRNALIISSAGGKLELLKMLVEQYKLNINHKNDYGITSLMASCNYYNKELIDLIIEKGANISEKDNKGWTALMLAAQNAHIEVVRLLIEKGSNINEKDNKGWTSLMLAAQNGYIEIVRLLIENGAYINNKENKNWTSLMIASQDNRIEIVRLLIENGASIDDENSNDRTALMIASKKGHREVVELLIERGANINEKEFNGWTPLMIASRDGHIEVVKLLLERGANINEKEFNGWTSLMIVSHNGHIEVV